MIISCCLQGIGFRFRLVRIIRKLSECLVDLTFRFVERSDDIRLVADLELRHQLNAALLS